VPLFDRYQKWVDFIDENDEDGNHFNWEVFYKYFVKTLKIRNPFLIKSSLPKASMRYHVFFNGCFNLDTKELEVNYGQAFNRMENVFPYDFDLSASNDPRYKEALDIWINNLFPNANHAQYFKAYMLLSAQNRGYECCSFPLLYGVRGTGKSKPGILMHKMLSEAHISFEGNGPLNQNNNHADIMLENKSVWVVQELQENKNISFDKLLEYYGADDEKPERSINKTGNPKGEEPRNYDFYAALFADSENVPQILSRKGGIFRRARFIKMHKRDFTAEESKNLGFIFQDYRQMFCWMIAQDHVEQLKKLKAVYKHPDLFDDMSEVIEANSTIPAFFDITLVESEGNKVDRQEIYAGYRRWCEENGERASASRTFFKDFKKFCEDSNIKAFADKNEKGEFFRSNGKYIWIGLDFLNQEGRW
jgi:phage/plasmid-associated DNA primase